MFSANLSLFQIRIAQVVVMNFFRFLRPCIALIMMCCAVSVSAGEVRAAVAANFMAPMRVIAADFKKTTGHRLILSFGSTGKLYAQIKNGAPFDVFFAADVKRPEKLEREQGIVPGSRFTYAIGQLALWSAKPSYATGKAALSRKDFKHIAIASPKLAPYGAASVEVMQALNVYDDLKAKLVKGQNIAQAHQFIASGNASLGFVALSQVYKNGNFSSGSGWAVSRNLYQPIRQQAVVLKLAVDHEAAQALMQYMQSKSAHEVIASFGYRY